MHAGTRNRFIHVKQVFTLSEAVNQNIHCPAIETMRTQPHQMVQHAGDFREHDAYVLSADRHVQTHQPFYRQAIRMLIAHHRHIVEPVHIGQSLNIGFTFSQFFGCAVKQTNVRVSTLHHLAIKFKHQTQNTMGCGVLWPKVQCVIFNISHMRSVQTAVVVFTNDARCDLSWLYGDGLVNHTLLLCVITHFDMTRRWEVFAERVSNETVVSEDAA